MLSKFINQQIDDSCKVKEKISNDIELINLVQEVSQKVIDTYKNGNNSA